MRWFAPFAFFLLSLMGAAILAWSGHLLYIVDRAHGHKPDMNFLLSVYIASVIFFLIIALFNLRGFIERLRRPDGSD